MSNLTLKISDAQIGFIRLILRSPDVGDGWRKVAPTVTPLVMGSAEELPELYELSSVNGELKIRLSERGKILSEYL